MTEDEATFEAQARDLVTYEEQLQKAEKTKREAMKTHNDKIKGLKGNIIRLVLEIRGGQKSLPLLLALFMLLPGLALAGTLVVGCRGEVFAGLRVIHAPAPIIAEQGTPAPPDSFVVENMSGRIRTGVASKSPDCPAAVTVTPLGPFTFQPREVKRWSLTVNTTNPVTWDCDCLELRPDPLP